MGTLCGAGNKWIEQAHADAAKQAQQNALGAHAHVLHQLAVGERVENDGDHHQADAPEEQGGISLGFDDVVQHRANDQRQADADGKRNGQPGNGDGRNQQNVGHVEHHAANEREQNVVGVRGAQIGHEAVGAGRIGAAHGEAQDERDQQNPKNVIPIEQLEAPALGELLGIGPATPADHGDDHHEQRERVQTWYEHLSTFAYPSYESRLF